MRVLSVFMVLVLSFCCGAVGVQVKVGDRSFPLETVKELRGLMDLDDNASPRLADTSVVAICANPQLPQVFKPVCQGKGAGILFSTLVYITTPWDPCEICANPSCFGCVI